MLARRLRRSSGGGLLIFGSDPSSLDGVDFFDGTADCGMIVFKTVGSYSPTCYAPGTVELLVIAGGGGSGGYGSNAYGNPGGGGAGGLLYFSSHVLDVGSITVIVGDGGDHGSGRGRRGSNGGNSQFDTVIATGGGGGGGTDSDDSANGRSGGSGGGGGYSGSGSAGSGIPGQGYDGEEGQWSGSMVGSGGGGGAGSAASENNGGSGYSKYGYTYCIGGCGLELFTPGSGNTSPIDNTGHGGGPESYSSGDQNDGSSGIVIVRWGGYSNNYDPTDDSVS